MQLEEKIIKMCSTRSNCNFKDQGKKKMKQEDIDGIWQ